MPSPSGPRHIVLFTFEDGMMLDVAGPADVFAAAAQYVEAGAGTPAPYRITLVAHEAGPVTLSNGLQMMAKAYRDVKGPIDTLLVGGGAEDGMRRIENDVAFQKWLRRKADTVRRLGSVCSGAFFLAQAGLLDGARATTHWVACERLAAEHPEIDVVPDAIYVKSSDGIYTSAGVSAGIDLALALVEEDLGRDVAMKVARHLVLFLRRPGGQSQFSAQLAAQSARKGRFDALLAHIAGNPEADLSVPALAERVAMSPRNFARLFREQVGETPAKYVERARLDAARRRLEEDDAKVDRVAADTGFGTAETLRRTMKRHLATTPEAYRASFGG
jgi:transcriptional regulator GlxA family with amidase domain